MYAQNYRPITLVSYHGKVFTSVVCILSLDFSIYFASYYYFFFFTIYDLKQIFIPLECVKTEKPLLINVYLVLRHLRLTVKFKMIEFWIRLSKAQKEKKKD